MNIKDIHRVYFLGIGGIGMSALARYFFSAGKRVAGYDRTETPLTDQLAGEGMEIHFDDNITDIPAAFRTKENTLIVYTPAIPPSHSEYSYFRIHGFEIMKRSQVLGLIMRSHITVAVAGTHGKTTISSLTAHIFRNSGFGCNAFLGGIAKNFNSNLVINDQSEYFIAEADEFDRSFLTLFPDYALVSAVDEDHLDIYGSGKNLLRAFNQFIAQIRHGGILILKYPVELNIPGYIRCYRYSLESACDFYARNITREGLYYHFSIQAPEGEFHDFQLGVSGKLNIENAVASFAIARLAGIDTGIIREAIRTYQGVQRRFDIRIQNDRQLFIDDYAHHPEELKAFITSVRELVPGRRICGIFQPHLYSRTRDLEDGFGRSLSLLDDVFLLPIYPAREEPIPGVDSGIILDRLTNNGIKILITKEELFEHIRKLKPAVLLSMGAGDIDQMVEPLTGLLSSINS